MLRLSSRRSLTNWSSSCSFCSVSSAATPARSLATVASSTPAASSRVDSSRIPPYQRLVDQLAVVRKLLDRPLTLSEKILYSHIRNPQEALSHVGKDVTKIRGKEYLKLTIDRLAMQGELNGLRKKEKGFALTLILRRCLGPNGTATVHDVRTAANGDPVLGAL